MSSSIRIAHLTSVHRHDDVRVFVKECATLAAAGYETHYVAPGAPDATIAGVHLHGLSCANAERRLRRMTATVYGVWNLARRIDADIYHFHDSELIPAGVLLKLCGKKVIYDAHENLQADIENRRYLPQGCRKLIGFLMHVVERCGAAFFDRVVAVTPLIAQRFAARKAVVVRNYPRISDLTTSAPRPYQERAPTCVYLGTISPHRGLFQMIDAMDALPAQLSARLTLVGEISAEDLDAARQRPGWRRVDYDGWRDRRGISQLLSEARIGLLLLQPAPNLLESYPVKMFEYMTAGVPIVASNFPAWRRFIVDCNCGLMVDPGDPLAIARAITWLLTHPAEAEQLGRHGWTAVRERYNWDTEARTLLEMYQALTPCSASPPQSHLR